MSNVTLLTRSQLFKKAHAITKRNIKKGDSYQVTFGICLKQLISEQPKEVKVLKGLTITTTYYKKPKVNKSVAMVGDYVKPKDSLLVKSCEFAVDNLDFFLFVCMPILFMIALTAIVITKNIAFC